MKKNTWIIFLLISLLALDYFLLHHGVTDSAGHAEPLGMSLGLGFLGGLGLILFAKFIGTFLLYRKPDYYEKENSS